MTETAWRILTIVLVAVVLLEGFVLIGVLRQVGAILMQIGPPRHGEVNEGPPKGMPLEIPGLTLDSPTVFLFLSPDCTFCKPITAALSGLRRRFREVSFIPIVVGGETPEAKESYREELGGGARTDLNYLFSDWSIPGTPFAVATTNGRRVRTSGVVNNLPQFENLLEGILDPEEEENSGTDQTIALVQVTRNGHQDE